MKARLSWTGLAGGDAVPVSLRLWILVLGLNAVGLALAFSLFGWGPGNVWVVGVLSVVAAVAERGRVRITRHTESSISLVPTLFAAVLFGPLASLIVAGASMAGSTHRPYAKRLAFTFSRAIAGSLGGISAVETASVSSNRFWNYTFATVVAATVVQLLDSVFFVVMAKLRGYRPGELFRGLWPPMAVAVPLYAPLVAALAYAYNAVSPWTLPLFFAPALAAQRLFGLYQDQRRLAEDLYEVNTRLERANISFATALVATLDARDRYTAGHSAAVAIYARDIATRLGLPEEQQQLAHLSGLVHDIGKIGLPPGLLEKPGSLTLEERRVMETHSEIGERILAKVDDYAEIALIVRHHHERWDGEGYPDRLSDTDIPLLSRIIAVADAYNAMTSDRPYRDAMPSRVARMRLAQGVESQFDTTVVAAFEAILASASEAYRTGRRADFILEIQDHLESELVAAEPAIVAEVA
jgi:putative nucleotidyltransferase with HDIG domain